MSAKVFFQTFFAMGGIMGETMGLLMGRAKSEYWFTDGRKCREKLWDFKMSANFFPNFFLQWEESWEKLWDY